jgi:hypothetical protein
LFKELQSALRKQQECIQRGDNTNHSRNGTRNYIPWKKLENAPVPVINTSKLPKKKDNKETQ